MTAPCKVMRCYRPAETAWIENAWGRRIETAVCRPHMLQLADGLPHQLTEDGWMLMDPDDLQASGELLVVGRKVSVRTGIHDETSSDPEHKVHLLFDVRRRGGDDLEQLDLVLTEEHAEMVVDVLQKMLRHGSGGDGVEV